VRIVLIRMVYRTGLQSVEREDGRFFLTLRNRTNTTEHEVPYETAMRYLRAMQDDRAAQILKEMVDDCYQR